MRAQAGIGAADCPLQLKGGSGRSTVATNLAAELSKQKTVCLVDADYPQGTSAAWYTVRQEQDKAGALMLTIARNHAELIEKVKRLYDAYDLVVIDTPPRVAELARATVMISDLLLVPMGPSAAELWATEDLLYTIQEAKLRSWWISTSLKGTNQ